MIDGPIVCDKCYEKWDKSKGCKCTREKSKNEKIKPLDRAIKELEEKYGIKPVIKT